MKRSTVRALAALSVLSAVASAQAPARAEESAPKPLVIKGDMRFRHDIQSSEGAAVEKFDQERLQMRVGALTTLGTGVEGEFRLASGAGRVSTNQTLGASNNAFLNYAVAIDRAYFDWNVAGDLHLVAGRRKNILFAPGNSDLIWDTDLNFDGLAVNYGLNLSDSKVSLVLSNDWLAKNTTADKKDNHLITGQLSARSKLADLDIAVGAGLFHYTNMTGQTAINGGTDFRGNSSITSAPPGATTTYATNFNILNFGGEVVAPLAGYPVTFLADYATNSSADAEKAAYLVGAKLGKIKKQGDWLVGYDFRKIGRDAVVGAFTDSDTANDSGSDVRSHRIRAAYGINDSLTFTASAFAGKKGIAEGESELRRNRFMFDLTLVF
jgi:hypothetical protein